MHAKDCFYIITIFITYFASMAIFATMYTIWMPERAGKSARELRDAFIAGWEE